MLRGALQGRPADRAAIIVEINKQTMEANRVAQPAGETAPVETPNEVADDEMSAF